MVIYSKKITTNTIVFIGIAAISFSELLNFQWTTSAAICGASAIMIYIWSNECENQFAMCIYLMLCFFIRTYTFYCMCLGVLWAVLYKCISKIDNNHQSVSKKDVLGLNIFRSILSYFRAILVWAMPLLIIVLLSFFIDHSNYSAKDWVAYREYCNSRAILYDYTGIPNYDDNVSFWDSNGFNEDTVDMLRMYQIGFLDDVGGNELDLISSYMKANRSSSFNFKSTVTTINNRLLHSSYIYILVPFFLCVVIHFCMKIRKKVFIDAIYIFFNIMFWGAVASYFIYSGKYPDRTEFIVVICMILNFFQTFTMEEYRGEVNAIGGFIRSKFLIDEVIMKKCVAILIIVIISVPLSKFFYEKYEIRKSQYDRNLIGTEIDNYFYENNKNYYVMCDATGIVVTKNFNIINKSVTPINTVETLGWGIRNPLWVNKLALMGGTSINEVIFKDNVYLCAYDEELASKIKRYIDNNITQCDMKEIDYTDFGLHVYKVNVREES